MTYYPAERRALHRTASNTRAVVVSADGAVRQPAIVRNVSQKGALVEMSGADKVIGEAYLLLPDHGMQPIDPVWYTSEKMGVRYPEDEA